MAMKKRLPSLAELHIKRGQLYSLIGAYHKAEDDFRHAYANATGNRIPVTSTRALLEIANIAYLEGQLQRSLTLLDEIKPLLKELHDHGLIFLYWRFKGNNYRLQGDYMAALACYRKILQQKSKKNQKNKAVALNLMGLAYHGSGEHKKAVMNIRRAYRIFKQIKNYSAQASCMANIAYVYAFSNKARQSLPYFEKSIALLHRLNTKSLIASPLLNWGSAFYNLGQYDNALEKWQEALTMNEELGDSAVVAMLHNNIGFALIKKTCYRESTRHFHTALVMKKKLGLSGYLPSTYNGFAKAYYNIFLKTKKQKDYSKASKYATIAKKIARSYNNKHDTEVAQKLLKNLAQLKRTVGVKS